MKEQFASYEIASKLKELGFDEECFGYYTPMKEWMMEGTKFNPERHFHGCNWANSNNTMYFMYLQNSFGDRTCVVRNSSFTKAIHNISVPLWQQVFEFLRGKGINIEIAYVNLGLWRTTAFKIFKTPEETDFRELVFTYAETYEKAREEIINLLLAELNKK